MRFPSMVTAHPAAKRMAPDQTHYLVDLSLVNVENALQKIQRQALFAPLALSML